MQFSMILVFLLFVSSAYSIDSYSGWLSHKEIDLITDEEVVVLMRHATIGINRLGEPPILVVRFTDYDSTVTNDFILQDIDIYIDWGVFVGTRNLTCMARVGEAEALQFELIPSTDNTTTFFTFSHMGQEGANMSFKVFLERQSQFIVRFTPYGDNPITAVFDLEGLLDAAEREGINTSAFLEWEGLDSSRARR